LALSATGRLFLLCSLLSSTSFYQIRRPRCLTRSGTLSLTSRPVGPPDRISGSHSYLRSTKDFFPGLVASLSRPFQVNPRVTHKPTPRYRQRRRRSSYEGFLLPPQGTPPSYSLFRPRCQDAHTRFPGNSALVPEAEPSPRFQQQAPSSRSLPNIFFAWSGFFLSRIFPNYTNSVVKLLCTFNPYFLFPRAVFAFPLSSSDL